MAAITGTTTTAQITPEVKELDFVSRFNHNWQAIRDVMGIMRPVRKAPGTKLVASKAKVTLKPGAVAEGDEVPLSQATVTPVAYADITLKKYRKAVTAEAVAKFGAAVASQKTDDAFLLELQSSVLTTFYTFLQTGTLASTETTWQMAIAMAAANVKDKFKHLHLDYSNVVIFVNTLDVGRYLGAANITVQTQSGIEYIENFMGLGTLIVSSEIPAGKVIATPADNIVMYYIDPSDGDFAELGLQYNTGNDEFRLIGVHKEGNYGRVMGETHALMGIELFAEYLDGIAVVTVGAAG